MQQEVILVNEQDQVLGSMEKIRAHRDALLHRAFSVFIFNKRGALLLQQRANEKYHSPGLWTNTCCSHPAPGEDTLEAAQRRLREEMGFSVPLTHAFSFVYKAAFDNGLTEHEYDHVFVGEYEGEVVPNAGEVRDYCYKMPAQIKEEISSHPHLYTEWFKIAIPELDNYLAARKS